MLSSPLLSLLVDAYKSGNLNPKIKGKISILSIGLEKEALPRTAERIIARVFTVEEIVTRGMPII